MRAVRLDTDVQGDRSSPEFAVVGNRIGTSLDIDGQEVDGDEVTAILYRHLHLPRAPHIADRQARELAESELRAALEGVLLAIDAYWLNDLFANRRARSKLLQLKQAIRHGLTVPDMRVTSDPEKIRALHRRFDWRMVSKLVGGQVPAPTADEQYVVFTTLLEQDDLRADDALTACPAIYQRCVEKAFDLRVTVVGERLFACRIDSQGHERGAVDWRGAGVGAVPISPYELDHDTASKCLALMRALGLDLAGLDLIVTPEGETVFLELNAAGQWLWVQEATGMPIAAAIVDQLLEGARRSCAGQRAPAPAPNVA